MDRDNDLPTSTKRGRRSNFSEVQIEAARRTQNETRNQILNRLRVKRHRKEEISSNQDRQTKRRKCDPSIESPLVNELQQNVESNISTASTTSYARAFSSSDPKPGDSRRDIERSLGDCDPPYRDPSLLAPSLQFTSNGYADGDNRVTIKDTDDADLAFQTTLSRSQSQQATDVIEVEPTLQSTREILADNDQAYTPFFHFVNSQTPTETEDGEDHRYWSTDDEENEGRLWRSSKEDNKEQNEVYQLNDTTSLQEWPYSTQPSNELKNIASRGRAESISSTDTESSVPAAEATQPQVCHRKGFDDAVLSQSPARMLFHHLQQFYGDQAKHAKQLVLHNDKFTEVGRQHSRLRDVSDVGTPINALGSLKMLSQPEAERYVMRARDLCRNMEGRQRAPDGRFDKPRSVCVHTSDIKSTDEVGSITTFDCDSHLGWACSFAAFLYGLHVYWIPPKTLQVTSEMHMPKDGIPDDFLGTDPHRFVRLKTTTHLCFAKVPQLGVTVYIYFPFINNETTLLSDRQLALWNNRVLVPAFDRTAALDVRSSLPTDFDCSRLRSKAAQVEGRARATQGYSGTADTKYYLDAVCCKSLWQAILDIISISEELAIFRDAQIFFTSKNTKLEHRNPVLGHCLRNFEEELRRAYDLNQIDLLLIDVGKEITPTGSKLRTCFFRKCCVKQAVRHLFASTNGKPCQPSQCMSTYHHCGLRDLNNFTAHPPRDSVFAKWGVLYAQWYCKVQVRVDATKRYPLAQDFIDNLAAGLHRASALASAGGSSIDIKTIEQGYIHGKERIHKETSKMYQTHGAREEFRLTHTAFRDLLYISETPDLRSHSLDAELHSIPYNLRHLYSIPTQEYLTFYWSTINYRCAYLEYVLASTFQRPTPEQSRVLLLMIHMARAFVQGTNFKHKTNRKLWIHKNENVVDGYQEIGAGFSKTMKEYGFCWLMPIVDWRTHAFRRILQRDVLFGHDPFYARYTARRANVIDFDSRFQAVLECEQIILEWQESDLHLKVRDVLVDIVLQQFRDDIRAIIKKDIRAELHGRLTDSAMTFSFADLSELYDGELYLCGVDKAMEATKNPRFLPARYFDDLDQDEPLEKTRLNFHNKPYRQLAWRAERIMRASKLLSCPQIVLGGSVFQHYLRLEWLNQHSLVPSISQKCPNMTDWQKTADGVSRRKWIVVHKERQASKNSLPYPEKGYHFRFGGKPSQEQTLSPTKHTLIPLKRVQQIRRSAEEQYGIR